MQIKKITLSGSPGDIGIQHGQLLAEQIQRNIEFYKPILLSNLGGEAQLLAAAALFKERIKTFNPDYIIEIDHIALGAEVSEPLWLYALNARTELALTTNSKECTAIVLPQGNVIGQTWDWAQGLEANFVVMEIEFPSGHKITQLTEAGIIGKIGLNNIGLGVTLNILWASDRVLDGVPIHILLRALLESVTLGEAREAIERSGGGKASNIIVAQGGRACDVEFLGAETQTQQIRETAYAHTNHYLHCADAPNGDEAESANSITRHKRAVERLRGLDEFSTQEMTAILSDRSDGEESILAGYTHDTQLDMGPCGTLATVVMDLEGKIMMVRSGNPSSASFAIDQFDEYHLT